MDVKPSNNEDLNINVVPFGPSSKKINQIISVLENNHSVQQFLQGTRHLLLSLEFINREDTPSNRNKCKNHPKSDTPSSPSHYQATYYDYTNNRTVIATGRINKPNHISVSQFDSQPLPSPEEFELAVNIVQENPELGRLIRENLVRPYRAMPSLIETELPDGQIERTLAVGLIPCGIISDENPEVEKQDTLEPLHQIVGANMIRREVIFYENGAPPFSIANDQICEPPPDSNQSTSNKGDLGQVQVTVHQGGTELWSFTAVRPASSTGIVGSGIELRHVKYREKQVLYRAHLPILNVRYDNDICGPFRDWQWMEGKIEAIGTDVAPGFRLCSTPARTILDTGFDTGNYLGVAIYVDGQEVVLVSEMQAGWYRYISEWRLHADGTILPRFGFSAIANSCTCKRHIHHAYWRFDFDIVTPGNNVVQEFNNPPIIGESNLHTKNYEIRRLRSPSHNRQWIISNKSTGEGYTLIPGTNDGSADSFGVGDVWILRYHSSELDDGQGFTVDVNKARANIDKFLNGEFINGQDVVIWYSAHFVHDESSEEEIKSVVGPELKPRNW